MEEPDNSTGIGSAPRSAQALDEDTGRWALRPQAFKYRPTVLSDTAMANSRSISCATAARVHR